MMCEDANSKLVEVVTVVDVDAEDHVGNGLLISELTLCSKSEQKFSFMTKRQLPNQQAVGNMILSININNSNNLNKF